MIETIDKEGQARVDKLTKEIKDMKALIEAKKSLGNQLLLEQKGLEALSKKLDSKFRIDLLDVLEAVQLSDNQENRRVEVMNDKKYQK